MIRSFALLVAWPSLCFGQTLTLPGNATLEIEQSAPLDSYAMPTGAWADAAIPTLTVEGNMTRQAWRVAATGLASLQLLRPLRDQLRAAGYEVLFECETDECGGFDFRFGTDVLPPPAMQIDLGDFRFLSATKADDTGLRAVSLLISRTPDAGFVQIIRVVPPEAEVPDLSAADAPPARAPLTMPIGDLPTALETTGHAVLTGVTFDTGAVSLATGDIAALQALADYMADRPDVQVSIVGHTDSQGGLEGNIAISRLRAAAVVERLVSAYGVARGRLTAAGMGYLAPVASNLSLEGRDANRRVEAVVTGPIQ